MLGSRDPFPLTPRGLAFDLALRTWPRDARSATGCEGTQRAEGKNFYYWSSLHDWLSYGIIWDNDPINMAYMWPVPIY